MQGEAAAATAERDETSAELASTREELDATESELSATNEELSETESALEAARAETAALRGARRGSVRAVRGRGRKAALAAPPPQRQRHRDRRAGVQQPRKGTKGPPSVRRNALGAGILRIETPVAEEAEAIAVDDGPEPADAADPNVAVPSDDEAIASKAATFELFEDAGGEWRWRLRHDNGNIISDSGEGYASKSNARARALGRVRESVAAARTTRVDPTAFECSGTPAASGAGGSSTRTGTCSPTPARGYSSRSKARQGLDSVQSNAAEAALEAVGDDGVAGDADGNPNATFELYEDAAEEYRWRLRHRNGNIIADSGEGYASESNARDARSGASASTPPTPTCWRSATPPFGSTRTPPTSGAGGSATATGTSSRTPAKGTPPGRTRSRSRGSRAEGERPGAEAGRRSRRRSRSALTRTFFGVLLNSRSGRRQELQP